MVETPPISPKTQKKIIQKKQKAVSQSKCAYRDYANGKHAIKFNKNHYKYLTTNLEYYKHQKRDINTQLNVALGKPFVESNKRYLKEVENHVSRQEELQRQIDNAKIEIDHLKSQINRTERETFELKKNGQTDLVYNENIRKAKSSLKLLEVRVDVSKNQECKMIVKNRKMRFEIDHLLYERALFNKIWQKLVKKLIANKTFLLEVTERAILAINQGVETFNQLASLQEKVQRNNKIHIREMDENIRQLDAADKIQTFYAVKGKVREISDLEPREIFRRIIFKEDRQQKIKLYTKVLSDVKKFYEVDEIQQVIEKFSNDENQYFSHFNYMNELTHHVEVLNTSLKNINENIDNCNISNEMKHMNDESLIENLTSKLTQETKIATTKLNRHKIQQELINRLLNKVTDIFRLLQCDDTELKTLLGDHTKVTKFNVEKFLAFLENKLSSVISFVYFNERKSLKTDQDWNRAKNDFIVRSVDRNWDNPTDINELILTQQCPECAEGEDVNRIDEKIVNPIPIEEAKNLVAEKLDAPEMRNRMHNISECRLPGSRNIVNKRYL